PTSRITRLVLQYAPPVLGGFRIGGRLAQRGIDRGIKPWLPRGMSRAGGTGEQENREPGTHRQYQYASTPGRREDRLHDARPQVSSPQTEWDIDDAGLNDREQEPERQHALEGRTRRERHRRLNRQDGAERDPIRLGCRRRMNVKIVRPTKA